MSEEFDPYAGFVGLSLDLISFTRFGVNFHISGKIDDNYKSYRLCASSNVAITEKAIFSPKSELDFTKPDTETIKHLFSFLEQEIVEFKPLKKTRACKLEFANGAIYVWEKEDDIVDNLFKVTDTSSGSDGAWWLIDDQ